MPGRSLTGWELVYAAVIFIGQVLEVVVRVALWVIIGIAVLVGFALVLLFAFTKLGRQAEYRTRPN